MIRRALCRANPVLRSVMARTGEQQVEFTTQAFDDLRQLVEQSYQPAVQEDLPQAEPTPQGSPRAQASAGSGEVGPGPLPHRTSGSGVGPGPLPVHGVTLQTFFSNLRGLCGVRKRDTTTKYEARYLGLGPERAVEFLLSLTVDPQRLLREQQSHTFDKHQPIHAGEDLDYLTEELAWTEQFKEDCEGTPYNGEQILRDQRINLVPMLDFKVYPTRTLTAPTSTVVVIPSSGETILSVGQRTNLQPQVL